MNAPQRHHRHREEPKVRPLRVGDTEKPGPEGEQKSCCISGFIERFLYANRISS